MKRILLTAMIAVQALVLATGCAKANQNKRIPNKFLDEMVQYNDATGKVARSGSVSLSFLVENINLTNDGDLYIQNGQIVNLDDKLIDWGSNDKEIGYCSLRLPADSANSALNIPVGEVLVFSPALDSSGEFHSSEAGVDTYRMTASFEGRTILMTCMKKTTSWTTLNDYGAGDYMTLHDLKQILGNLVWWRNVELP